LTSAHRVVQECQLRKCREGTFMSRFSRGHDSEGQAR
jgi:hypothetical protein